MKSALQTKAEEENKEVEVETEKRITTISIFNSIASVYYDGSIYWIIKLFE